MVVKYAPHPADKGYPWLVCDDTGNFKEGHSTLENALKSKPEAKVDEPSYRRYLSALHLVACRAGFAKQSAT